ncbi:MAG: winged helix-turn-helix transcriptional regulator [Pseudomonadota bacterium]|nr:winged helix-turn-helix transcriptional regulator [Pseudomonadota bacterium]
MIVILSPDKDFAQPLAEQAARVLSLPCQVAENLEKAKDFLPKAALVIAGEPQDIADCPLLAPKTRPFRLQDLLDEAAAILQKQASGETLSLAGWQLQPRAKRLTRDGKSADLTDKETQLLQCLIEAGGKGAGREQLLKAVWGFEAALDTHTLETHIYRLRGKFRELSGEDPIAAVEGGYKIML